MNKKLIILLLIIFILLSIGVTIFLIYMKSHKKLVDLQNQIMDLINGKIPINNLKVFNKLNILSSNKNDMFPLKLLTSSNNNMISFTRYGTLYNKFGTQSPLPSSSTTKSYTKSLPVNLKSQSVLSIDSLQQQINDIISGKTPLNNLKVNNSLTIVSKGGYLKTKTPNTYYLPSEGGLSLVNQDQNKNLLDSCVLFGDTNGNVKGYYGLKLYNNSTYDRYSVNLSYVFNNWDSRPNIPSCTDSTPVLPPEIKNDKNIDSLLLQFSNIVNGITPITNLVVNGDVTVTSNIESPLILDVQTCNATSLVGFNNLDARGVNAYGGPFDWVGPFFDFNYSYNNQVFI